MSNQEWPADISRTVRELAELRRAIEVSAAARPGHRRAVQLHLAIHFCAILFAALLVLAEFLMPWGPTQFLIETHFTERLRTFAIAFIGLVLIMLVAVLYFIIWCTARIEGESFESFAGRNFSYLSFLGFLSDLFVKFCAVSLVILAGRGDWVAPLLMIFLSDYLIQGRFFVLPVRLGLLLALLLIMLGILQCLLWYGTVLLPLGAFILLSVMTIVHLAGKASRLA